MSDEGKTQTEEILELVHEVAAEVKEKGLETGEQIEKLEKMAADLTDEMAELRQLNAESAAEKAAAEAERTTGYKAHIECGTRYDGMKTSDVVMAGYMLKGLATSKGIAFDRIASDDLVKALTSTTGSSGDEWVPTGMASELYSEWEKQSVIYSLFPRVDMPTNPFDLPIVTADPTVYLGSTESTATSESSPTSSKITLTGGKLMAETDYSYEVDEDAIIAVAPLVQSRLNMAMSAAMDSVIANGDTTTGSANINYFGTGSVSASIGTASRFLHSNGLRYQGLIANTACKADLSGLAIADFGTLMSKQGKYATRPSDNVWISDVWTWIKAVQLSDFITIDKYGQAATLLTGELGKVYGSPYLLSEELAKAASTGTVNQTAADNTLGTLLRVHTPSWIVGSKRQVMVETDKDIQKQQMQVVISTRMALSSFGTAASATHTAVGYDVVIT